MLLGTGRKKMLNSSAAVPLYVQLKEKIEQKISDGEYKPGEKLQTEGEMAKSFGVSIITVRKAVSELVEKGLVEKKQGKGTFVCQRKVTKDMKKLQSFSEMCAHMGMKAGGRMLENRLEPASEKIARLLNVEKAARLSIYPESAMRMVCRWRLSVTIFHLNMHFFWKNDLMTIHCLHF